ncbi:unnamed protein product [Rangifer tarandus platyrhynchus]|uniref:Uncharacterized protein n=1 Tax=Rangifer tarandus platyrhynchus TaxID=3082113 RepID=A0AC59ZB13_RANTA
MSSDSDVLVWASPALPPQHMRRVDSREWHPGAPPSSGGLDLTSGDAPRAELAPRFPVLTPCPTAAPVVSARGGQGRLAHTPLSGQPREAHPLSGLGRSFHEEASLQEVSLLHSSLALTPSTCGGTRVRGVGRGRWAAAVELGGDVPTASGRGEGPGQGTPTPSTGAVLPEELGGAPERQARRPAEAQVRLQSESCLWPKLDALVWEGSTWGGGQSPSWNQRLFTLSPSSGRQGSGLQGVWTGFRCDAESCAAPCTRATGSPPLTPSQPPSSSPPLPGASS